MRITTTLQIAALAACFGLLATPAQAQDFEGPAERSLVGITLFDTGLKVVSKYGSPMHVQPLTFNAGGAGGGNPGGGGGAAGGGGSGPSGNAADPIVDTTTPPGPGTFSIPINQNDPMPGFIGDPFSIGRFRQLGLPGNRGGAPAAPGQVGGAEGPATGGGGAAGGGGAGAGNRVTVVRWIYERGSSRYAFIMDEFNRVVQIEAVGLYDSRPRTRRGINFGDNFDDIIKAYRDPDAYEIFGEHFIVRYLVLERVAFRMSRVHADRPHCVTGIVVAAGKQ